MLKKRGTFRKPHHGIRQIRVRPRMPRHEPPDERKDRAEIREIQLAEGGGLWPREFKDNDATAGVQHAPHLAETLVQVLEIPDPEGYDSGVERPVAEREPFRVSQFERHPVLHAAAAQLLPPDGQHLLGNIHSHDPFGAEPEGGEREVSGSCRHVQDRPGRMGPEVLDRLPPPVEVDPPAEQVVQEVVPVGDRVEERSHVLLVCARNIHGEHKR